MEGILLKLKLDGWLWTARHAASALLARWSSAVHIAMLDVALMIHPTEAAKTSAIGPTRRWLGIVVLVLLVAGLAFVGEGAIGAMQAALPHREQRQ